MSLKVDEKFVSEYSRMVTDNICEANGVDPQDQKSRTVLAWKILQSQQGNSVEPNDVTDKNNLYYLMNKNDIIATIRLCTVLGSESFTIENIYGILPYNITPVTKWLESRKAAKHRKQLKALMEECGCDTLTGLISVTHCTTLNDTFWIKPTTSSLMWQQVNLYDNPFDDVIAHIAFDGVGLYGKEFTSTTPEFGTSGNFEKCWIRESGNTYLIKRGTEGFANAGMEPYSEALYSQIAKCFSIDYVDYTLLKYHNRLATKCKLFTDQNLSFVPMAYYDPDIYPLTNFYEIYAKFGFGEFFARMLVLDALTLNCDRHFGNFGWLVNSETMEVVKPAPLFDYNLSCLPYIMETDNVTEYIEEMCRPKIGKDFARVAKAVLNPSIRAELINTKSFEYQNPGYNFPEWRVKMLNDIKDNMITSILS